MNRFVDAGRRHDIYATIVIMLISVFVPNCSSYEPADFNKTEAQRYYDLGVSYIKSDLYEDGLKTLNQVAFLYPDSDVADDALYQLALIREQVGDGKIIVGSAQSIEAEREVLNRLTGSSTNLGILTDILVIVNAHLSGKRVLDEAKNRAIAQYLLAIDYLVTLSQRYPHSNMLEESKLAFERTTEKIDILAKQPPHIPMAGKATRGAAIVIVALFIAILVIPNMVR